MKRALGPLLFWLAFATGCGGESERDKTRNSAGGSAQGGHAQGGVATGAVATGGSAQGGTSAGGASVDCSNVGCAQAPLCAVGCTAVCGCCGCPEGEAMEQGGVSYVCQGGCYAELTAVDWISFTVSQGWGPCPDDSCSKEWIAGSNGVLNTLEDGVYGTKQKFAGVDELSAIFAEPEFQQGIHFGFECDAPPTDVGYSITLETTSETLTQDVTGCVLTGPAGNAAGRAVAICTAY